MARLIAALSGGVDSAVAAARMVDAGHEVTAIHLALLRDPATHRTGSRGCCSVEDALDARRVADRLGVPFYIWDLSAAFQAEVVDDFVAEYARGHTPNPCLRCNERIKFAAVLERALSLGFDGVVTGHYARIERQGDRIALHRALDLAKDQSYVLGVMTAAQLRQSYFPLGDTTKAEVRLEAARRGLKVASKPDSYDICFISDGTTAAWLTDKLGARPGLIVDESGTTVGAHNGTFGYTVGQRRGLRLGRPAADGRPRYVLKIDPVSATVTVGPHEHLAVHHIDATQPVWCGEPPAAEFPAIVQLRAHGGEHEVMVRLSGPASVAITLVTPAYGIAPGQTAVIYRATQVVGSATITVAD